MFKLVVGILKGAVIGCALGYGAFALKEATDFSIPWFTYGVVGTLVGLIAGRPIWSLLRDKNATAWVSILRAAVGFGVGVGLYTLIAKVWNPSAINVGDYNIFAWPVTLGGAIGAAYGGIIELDDSIGGDDKKPGAESGRPGPAPTLKSTPKAAPKAKGAPGR